MFVSRVIWLRRIADALAAQRVALDPPDALPILARLLAALERDLEASLEDGVAAGLLLHLLFSARSSQSQKVHVKREARDYLEHQFPRELARCKSAIRVANQQYHFSLSENEAYNILGILRNIDIFIFVNQYFYRAEPPERV